MVAFPFCKINLGLNILARRDDGYHDVATGYYPVPWTDVLEIVPADTFRFSQHGNPLPEGENLCVRAWNLLQHDFPLDPVEIHLLKKIPAGAGLGGGSSDAAFTLRLLNEHFRLGLRDEQLAGYAARLGSDCPFFVYGGKPMVGRGRGERLEPLALSLKGMHLVIVKPDLHISTADAFRDITPRQPETDVREILEKHPPEAWSKALRNDFQEGMFRRFPTLEAIHAGLCQQGAVYASMTGTGSAVYGIFRDPPALSGLFEGYTSRTVILD